MVKTFIIIFLFGKKLSLFFNYLKKKPHNENNFSCEIILFTFFVIKVEFFFQKKYRKNRLSFTYILVIYIYNLIFHFLTCNFVRFEMLYPIVIFMWIIRTNKWKHYISIYFLFFGNLVPKIVKYFLKDYSSMSTLLKIKL